MPTNSKRFPEEFGGLQILGETPEDFPGMSPKAVIGIFVPHRPADLSLDELRADLTAIGRDDPGAYEVKISDDQMHWGMSDILTNALLLLGGSVLNPVVESALRAIARKWGERGGSCDLNRQLTADEAEGYAQWFTDATYSDSAPFSVRSRSSQPSAGQWRFDLKATGIKVLTTVELDHGLPVVRIERLTEFDRTGEQNLLRR